MHYRETLFQQFGCPGGNDQSTKTPCLSFQGIESRFIEFYHVCYKLFLTEKLGDMHIQLSRYHSDSEA